MLSGLVSVSLFLETLVFVTDFNNCCVNLPSTMDPSDSFSNWAAFLVFEARTHSRLQHILFRLWPPSGDLAIDQPISRYALLQKLIGPLFIEVCHGLRSLRVLAFTLPRSAVLQASWDTSDWWATEIQRRLETSDFSVVVEGSTEHGEPPCPRLVIFLTHDA